MNALCSDRSGLWEGDFGGGDGRVDLAALYNGSGTAQMVCM